MEVRNRGEIPCAANQRTGLESVEIAGEVGGDRFHDLIRGTAGLLIPRFGWGRIRQLNPRIGWGGMGQFNPRIGRGGMGQFNPRLGYGAEAPFIPRL